MIATKNKLGKYQIIDIWEEFSVIADLDEFDIFLDGLLRRKNLFIAVRFKDISYIYSGALSVIIQATKRLASQGGQLCLLEPDRRVLDIIHTLNLDKVLRIFHSEEALLEFQRTVI